MKKLNIGYFADGKWAHKTLSFLLHDKDIKISFICLRYKFPDKFLQQEAINKKIDLFKEADINNNEFVQKISSYNCDLFISMSFNQIFKKSILSLPKLGTINCHASKLPFYRGRNILNWVLINDEKEFGITVHYVDEGIDTGDIILQKTFPIDDNDDYSTLLKLSFEECPILLNQSLILIKKGNVVPIRQDSIHPKGSYCKRREEGDELINWDKNTRDLFNFIRGITSPGPCAQSFIKNNLIKIIRAEIPKVNKFSYGNPGEIMELGKDYFIAKTKDGVLKITSWDCLINVEIGDKLC